MNKSSKKNSTAFKLLLVTAILSAIIFYVDFKRYSIFGNVVKKVVLKGEVFNVELADTEIKQQRGLGGRKEICNNCGMLFVFPDNRKRPFWMKDMEFSLDIIWLDNGKVVKIEKNIAADSQKIFSPDIGSDQVLEVNAGISDSFGIAEGDRMVAK